METDEELENAASIETALEDGPHNDAFIRAVNNILATEVAELTYAQIVDGLPLSEVAVDVGYGSLHDDHPIHESHPTLCSGVLEKTRDLRQHLRLKDLKFKPKLLHDFRSSSPGSRAFNVRLIEIVAVAVHQIAVDLFNIEDHHHTDEDLASWTPPKDDDYWGYYPEGRWPTLFYHPWYDNHKYYPNGVADIVGYWAEAQILGGVVLFDRRDPKSSIDVQPESVWFHPNRGTVTYRICRLTDKQRQALLEFLTSESPDLQLLPILPDESNTVRKDPEEPVAVTGVYRDIWERKAPVEEDGDDRLRDVWSQFDYPTWADFDRAHCRARERKQEFYRKAFEEEEQS